MAKLFIGRWWLNSFTVFTTVLGIVGADNSNGLWLETTDLAYFPSNSGTQPGQMEDPWTETRLCSSGSFVTGYEIHFDDNGHIHGLTLKCSRLSSSSDNQMIDTPSVKIGDKQQGDTSNIFMSHTVAQGFLVQKYERCDKGDSWMVIGRRQMLFYNEKLPIDSFPNGVDSKVIDQVLCPSSWAICGAQGQFHRVFDGINTADVLARLRFKCCYFCIPRDFVKTIQDYTNYGATTQKLQTTWKVGYRLEKSQTVGTRLDFAKEFRRETSATTSESRSKGSKSSDSSSDTMRTDSTNTHGSDRKDGAGSSQGTSSSLDVGNSVVETAGETSSNNQIQSRGSTTGSGSKDASRIGTSHTSGNTVTDSKSLGTSDSNRRSTSDKEKVSSTHNTGATIEVGAKASVGFPGFGAEIETKVSGHEENTNTEESEKEQVQETSKQVDHQKKTENSHTNNQETSENKEQEQTRHNSVDEKVELESKNEKSKNTELKKDQRIQTTRSGNIEINTSKGSFITLATSDEKSTTRGKELANEVSIQESAQAIFSSKYMDSSSSGQNWANTLSSSWHEERENVVPHDCPAMHQCVLTLAIGQCGVMQFQTNKFVFKTRSLLDEPSTAPQETELDDRDIKRPDEFWIVARDISFFERSRTWRPLSVCPPDTVVTGHQFKILFPFAVTGLSLQCSRINKTNTTDIQLVTRLESLTTVVGAWGKEIQRSSPAVGFRYLTMERNGNRLLGRHELVYQEEDKPLNLPHWATNSSWVNVNCPIDHVVCGLQTMMDNIGQNFLTNVGLKCCRFCIPTQINVTVTQFHNTALDDVPRRLKWVVRLQSGTEVSKTNSSGSGNSVSSAGVRRDGLNKGVEGEISSSNSLNGESSDVKTHLGVEEIEEEYNYVCPARHCCAVKQLVNKCGSKETKINSWYLETDPLDPPTSTTPPAEEDPFSLDIDGHLFDTRNNELWSEISGLSPRTPSEHWESAVSCPPGSFVNGQIRQHSSLLGLTGLDLRCSNQWPDGSFTRISSAMELASNSVVQTFKSEATGFSFIRFVNAQGLQQTTGHTLTYHGIRYGKKPPGSTKVTRVSAECPPNFRVCGVQVRFDETETVLTDLKFRCCYFCKPHLQMRLVSDIKNDGPSIQQTQYTVAVGSNFKRLKEDFDQNGGVPPSLILGGENYKHIRELFASQLTGAQGGNLTRRTTGNIDWRSTGRRLWTTENSQIHPHKCSPMQWCVVNQVVVECDSVEVRTSSLRLQEVPVKDH